MSRPFSEDVAPPRCSATVNFGFSVVKCNLDIHHERFGSPHKGIKIPLFFNWVFEDSPTIEISQEQREYILLFDQLVLDQLEARRNRDDVPKRVLTYALARIHAVAKEVGVDPTDEMAEAELVKLRKELGTQAAEYRDAGRMEAALDEEAQMVVIEKYLPKLLTSDELAAIVESLIEQTENPAIGGVMKAIRSQYGPRVDGKLLSQIVKEKLKETKDAADAEDT